MATQPLGWWLVALWAFGEAIWLPVVPDVLLGLLVLAAPRRAGALFLAVLAGSLVGSFVLYGIAIVSPDLARTIVLGVPGVRPEMLGQASQLLAGGDPLPMARFGPGAPLKVDTLAWALGSGGPIGLAIGVVVNRVTRVGPVLLVTAAIGWLAPGTLRKWQWPVIGIYAGLWIATYVLYLG